MRPNSRCGRLLYGIQLVSREAGITTKAFIADEIINVKLILK
jgi:hypothetical protein